MPMRTLRFFVIAALLPGLLLSAQSRHVPEGALVITHVTVIDATGRARQKDQTVVILNGRIARIGKSRAVEMPANSKVLDASGKFLIPGLWDMHIHSGRYEGVKKYFPTLVASGITSVRDMGTPLDDVLRLHSETAEGNILGPRMVVAGPLLEGPLPPQLSQLPLLYAVKDAAQAKQAVEFLKGRGVDFLKVHDLLPRDVYFALAEEARRQGIPFSGHVPPSISAAEASNAGQRSIEHLGGRYYGVLIACSSREDELRGRVVAIFNEAKRAASQGQEPDDSDLFRAGLLKLLLESFSESKAAALFSLFARNHTWQVPTLVSLEDLWAPQRAGLNAEDVQYNQKLFQRDLTVVGAMHGAGVKLMAGTDSSPDGEPAKLRKELALLVEAGLTPMEALQAATRAPAEFLGRLDSAGTVEAGKSAHLVLLDADPLENIENVGKVWAVVRDGRLIIHAEILQLRAQPENARRVQ